MSTSENNDPINKSKVRKEIEAKIENIRRIFEEFASKQSSEETQQAKPTNKPISEDIMFFSLDANECEFPPNPSSEWTTSACPPPDAYRDKAPKISPDLQDFMVGAGTLLYDAIYSPFVTSNGRMSRFFACVDQARVKMSNGNFSASDCKAFTDWCILAGETLQDSTSKGLWLTDSEDDFVAAMSSGEIMSISESDSSEDIL